MVDKGRWDQLSVSWEGPASTRAGAVRLLQSGIGAELTGEGQLDFQAVMSLLTAETSHIHVMHSEGDQSMKLWFSSHHVDLPEQGAKWSAGLPNVRAFQVRMLREDKDVHKG